VGIASSIFPPRPAPGQCVITDRLSATIAAAAGVFIPHVSAAGARQAAVICALAFALPVPLRLAAVAEAFNPGTAAPGGQV
jgi:hypothetical protein